MNKFLLGLIAISFCSFLILPASAATYYVSTTGDNNNAGTAEAPWKNIQYGIDHMSGSDTLIVREGTYFEPDGLNITYAHNISGTATAPTTIKTEGKVVVQTNENKTGLSIKGYYAGYDVITIYYVDVEGLTFSQHIGCKGIYLYQVSACSLERNIVQGITTNTTNGNSPHGIYLEGCKWCTVKGNQIYNINGFGRPTSSIYLYGGSYNEISENTLINACAAEWNKPA